MRDNCLESYENLQLGFAGGRRAAGNGVCSSKPPEMLRTATIKDIMDSMVDPNGDFIFESIEQIADEKGVREKAPRTDKDCGKTCGIIFSC